ncbi:MAG: nitrogenase iron-molybdenum cofactor biosynthesis protein NifN [Desulfuromonas thiophila]|nr:nitrogenase iron-molybdenum cofactor biosynthesis protein NifN [Desulfuromonas thiophila]
MAALTPAPTRALQINPFKLSQPMGAALAFFGIEGCLPLMHGAQGCASFTKVFFTRHFCEPIAIQTTAVSDICAILDGGDAGIAEALRTIGEKSRPALIGLHSTGLTETKGDDLQRAARQLDQGENGLPLVWVATPDYEGGFESGWALATRALIEQLVEPQRHCTPRQLVLLPHVSLQPLEVERIKELIAAFGFRVLALPDLSSALDGHLGQGQSVLSDGGLPLAELRTLARCSHVLAIGHSMRPCAEALQRKNPAMQLWSCDHLQGLLATDALIGRLLAASGRKRPPVAVARWRSRLQDALLDCHFALGQTRFALSGEPDQLVGLAAALGEAGGQVVLAVASTATPQLANVAADRVQVGDLADIAAAAADFDVLIGNFHAERLSHQLGKGLLLRGYPNWEELGSQLKSDLLYEGSCHFLFEAANTAERWRNQRHCPPHA